MRVRFLGPIGRVTGSCTWLVDDDLDIEFLVDCGMVQGEDGAGGGWNNGELGFDPGKLKLIVLTHAHLDHSGLIPLLYKRGFKGTVYCTRETAELARLVIEDAAKQPGSPYTMADVKRVRFHEPANDRALSSKTPLHRDVFVSFFRTSHILGAVSVRLSWIDRCRAERSILFSGDLGPNEEGSEQQHLIRYRKPPWSSSYAVVESTYGSTSRSANETATYRRVEQLENEIARVGEQGGALVMCAFAIDRTQVLLLEVNEVLRRDAAGPRCLDRLRLVLHAPLATRVSDVYARAMKRKVTGKDGKVRPYWLSQSLFGWLGLDPTNARHERAVELYLGLLFSSEVPCVKPEDAELLESLIPGASRRHEVVFEHQVLDDRPTVLVTGSGMCEGGPVIGYLADLLPRDDVTLAFAGFLASGTIGGKLARLERVSASDRGRLAEEIEWNHGKQRLRMPLAEVRARFVRLVGYSAHADRDGLVRWILRPGAAGWEAVAPVIFVQHGTEHARRSLIDAIRLRAEAGPELTAIAPDGVRWFDLDAGRWLSEAPKSRAELERELDALRQQLRSPTSESSF
jgi:metallo-beta-lactamase family protein